MAEMEGFKESRPIMGLMRLCVDCKEEIYRCIRVASIP